MSAYDGYDDEPRRYRNVRTRPRERDEPDVVREEVYIERGKGSGPRGAELVYRGRDDSIEDIRRDFPPPGRSSRHSGYDDYAAPRRSKSTGGRRYDSDSEDDRYTDYGAAGAAGYAAGRNRDRRHRRDDRDYDSEYSNSPPRRERKKSGVGDLLGSLGLGGLVGGIAGSKDRSRSRSGSRGGRSTRSTRSRSRGARSRRGYSSDGSGDSRSRGGKNERKWAQAAQAALVAGAVEAFRSRKTPGPWTGEKGKRIATAALGAGGIDGLVSGKNPDDKSKRHLAEAVIGGLGINRLANGSRSQVRGDSRDRSFSPDGRPRSRSRSIVDRLRGRSQSRGRNSDAGGGGNGVAKGLLGAGAAAVAGKALYSRFRSKSRKRRSSSRSSSADSYVPSRTRARDRRRSPRSDTGPTRPSDGPGLRGGQDDRARARGTSRGGTLVAAGGGAGAGALAARGVGGGGDKDSNGKDDGNGSDSSSTTDMEKTRKHMRGKEIITASLATVATIHAAHGVYSSMEAHEKRHKLVAEGEMSPEEARKKQTKAWIQDAAAVGIAALGIKGAFSEWKEMNEQRREIQNLEKRKAMKRKAKIAKEKADERERHDRLLRAMENNPGMALGYHMNQNFGQAAGGAPQGAPPQPDLSGNPYAPRDGGSQRY